MLVSWSLMLQYIIHVFRPTCPFLIVEVLSIRGKFMEPSNYATVTNCTFVQQIVLVASSKFELITHKLLN